MLIKLIPEEVIKIKSELLLLDRLGKSELLISLVISKDKKLQPESLLKHKGSLIKYSKEASSLLINTNLTTHLKQSNSKPSAEAFHLFQRCPQIADEPRQSLH